MMNKRSFMLGLIFLWCMLGVIGNYSYGEETYTENDMKAVAVRFCGEWTWESTHNGTYYVEPGKEKHIRLCIRNAWSKKMMFVYGFSESWIRKGRYCQGDMSTGNKFSVLIPQTKDRTVTIDPSSEKVIEEKIVIPAGMSWLQLGCVGYNLLKPENTNVGGMFSLKIRKVGYIDIMVGWAADVQSSIKVLDMSWGVFTTNKKIKAEVDAENNLKLTFRIANEWNISQSITITGRVTNMLWFQQPFSITQQAVAPGSTNEFSTNVGIVPSYKWFFKISFTVQNDPQFIFPVSDEKLKQPWYISEIWKIFIFSWVWIVVIVVLIFLLYKIFVPRRVKSVTA